MLLFNFHIAHFGKIVITYIFTYLRLNSRQRIND
nr:MAG TPA: hypothetical protein [Caudoviricetes sp.]